MKSFEYTIKEPVGLHARPAGMLNKEARKYKSAIIINHGAKSANVLRLMAVSLPNSKDCFLVIPCYTKRKITWRACYA